MRSVPSIRRSVLQYLLCVALIPLVAISIFFVLHTRNMLINREIRSMRMVGKEVVREITSLMTHAASDLSVSAVHPRLRKLDLTREEAEAYLRGLHSIYRVFSDISLYDRRGVPIASSLYSYWEDAERSPWFSRAMAGEVIATPPHKMIDRPGLHVTLYQPVRNSEWNVFRVLLARISFTEISRILNGADLGGEGEMVLLDSYGNILSHPDRTRELDKFRDLGDDVMLGTVSEGIATGESGKRVLFSSLEMSSEQTHTGQTWRLICIRPHNVVMASLRQQQTTLIGVGVLTVLLSVLMGILFGKRLADPIGRAAAAARDISEGNLNVAVPSEGFSEVRELAVAMNTMVAEVKDHRERLEKLVAERTGKLEESRASLQEVLHRHEVILDSVGEGIFGLNAERRISFVNPVGARLLGWDASQLLGKDAVEAFHYLNPDGSRHDANTCRILRVIDTGEPLLDEDEIFVRKDGSMFPVRFIVTPTKDEHGFVSGVVIAFQDITREKEADSKLKESEESLRQTQKMEAIGRLAGGVAHDFNNLLTAILGHVELLLLDLEKGSPFVQDLEEVRTQVERGERLTRQLLAFSRRQVLQPQVLNLNDIIRGMEMLLHRLLGEDIEVSLHIDSDLCMVKTDRGQIEQVIMNLAVNAREAMPKGGRLVVETKNFTADDTFSDISPGGYALLEVSDTGTGMSHDVLARIFEPFFTTKPQGKGVGIGLSTVYGIVNQSKGTIRVYSEVGKGSTFKVFLPSAEAEAAHAETDVRDEQDLSGDETILIVEDEDMVRRALSRQLARNGYTVIDAPDGEVALEVMKKHHGEVHAVITDIVMPRMNGRELADSLKKEYPGIGIVFMSGYTEHILTQGNVAEDEIFVQKPFSFTMIAKALRTVIAKIRDEA
ncbi:MAG: response regulator [Verrucomicrobia bacterium]|nr:response regulator [Verrucomicrobiota bacterium]